MFSCNHSSTRHNVRWSVSWFFGQLVCLSVCQSVPLFLLKIIDVVCFMMWMFVCCLMLNFELMMVTILLWCLTLFYTWGGGINAPYLSNQFFFTSSYQRRLQEYSKFKFRNYVSPKIDLESEQISGGLWEGSSFFWSVFARKFVTIILSLKQDFSCWN